MRVALALLLAGCSNGGVINYVNNCGLVADGTTSDPNETSWVTEDVLNKATFRALNVAESSTDQGLQDRKRNCEKLQGVRIVTNPEYAFKTAWYDFKVAGITYCFSLSRYVVVGTPYSHDWRKSSLIHELIHVMQGCSSPPPTDPGLLPMHSNWDRDGINSGVEAAARLPE